MYPSHGLGLGVVFVALLRCLNGSVNDLGRKAYLWSFYHSFPLLKRPLPLTLTAKDWREYSPPFTSYCLDPSSEYSHMTILK